MTPPRALRCFVLSALICSRMVAANWTITDLGALGAPGNVSYESRAYNINNAGQVAGKGVVLIDGVLQNHYVVWSNGTQIDLGIRINSSWVDAAPINDAGQVAGVIEAENFLPFLWQAGVVTQLPKLAGTTDASVTGINASGAVLGYLRVGTGPPKRTVLWQGGIVNDLGLDLADSAAATAINDHGHIAINGYYYSTGRSAVLTGGATNMVEVPGVHPNYGLAQALDLNNAGQVCGRFTSDMTVASGYHAFIWQQGVGGVPLPEFSSGLSHSEAVALNNLGHAVGNAYSFASGMNPAVLWRDDAMTILNDLPEVQAAGWWLMAARDINDHDQIVGIGSHGGLVKAFLLSPVTAPALVSFTTNTVPVGGGDSGPDCLATADVNGDGRLDLISANYGFRWANPGEPGGWNTTLTVLTNNGSGGFASNATLTVGAGPASVVAVDVNGDGRSDIISADQTASTLTVLTNDGTGFGWQASLPVGRMPSSLVAADVNGDWFLDLAVVNSGDNSLTVLTNNGRGVFGLQGTFPVGAKPGFLVTADVNGDRRPDLISVNHDANSMTVVTNNGSGGFNLSATLAVGNLPVAAAAGDVNGDGWPDLAAVNWGANTITVLTNNGQGVFGLQATLPVGTMPSSVAVGDFTGDGAADLICANTSSGTENSLTVYTNSGSGSFGLQTTLALGSIPTSLLAADVNSDGRLDASFLNFRDGTLTVLLNTTLFAAAVSQPALSISLEGGAVRMAWPSASPGWSLQQKREVTAPNWLPSGHDGYLLADDRTNKSLTLPAANAGLLFHLLHP